MPITAKDIARELQLSQPTVSRILSGDPQHRVAAATRTRVMETAQRLGYQPNAVARSLRRGRTGIVGLYTNHDYDARNEFVGTIIGALQRACEAQGLDLLLHSARGGRSAREMYGKLRDGRVDGLILHANADDPLVTLLGQSSLPVVTVADSLPDLTSVTCDDADGIRQLMAFLWGRGYRRFAFVGPNQRLTSVERRRAAFVSEVQRRGLSEADGRIVTISDEHAGEALDPLRQSDRPCAAFCWNDRSAYELLQAALAHGVNVPDELAVVGFDGFQNQKIPVYRLVTVHCPWEEVAVTALDALIARLNSPDARPAPEEICLPVTLVAGDTA